MKTKIEIKNGAWTQFKNFSAIRSGVVLLCLTASLATAQTYTILHSFGTNVMGRFPHSQLVQGADSALYGTTLQGGIADRGQVYKVNLDGSGYTVLKDFTASDGANPVGSLVLSGTTLYGTTRTGGISNNGTIYRLNCDGSEFAVLTQFTGSNGANPEAGLVLLGTTLYGTTRNGGIRGKLFKVNTDGSDFTVLKDFAESDGTSPVGRLVLSGSTLYGTTFDGGSNGRGTVFKVETDGSSYSVLKHFAGIDGEYPHSGLVLSGTTLYGTTWSGGSFKRGTVFRVNTDGSGFSVLKEFALDDGSIPNAELVLAGGTLCGTTYLGGISNCGTVFNLRTDGSAYTVLKNFVRSEQSPGGPPGDEWTSGLFLSGTTLYGTSQAGGVAASGALFKLNINGSGFAMLKEFTGGDGQQPYSGLLMGSDGCLYGTTSTGGRVRAGTVFKLNTDGSGYAVLKEFMAEDGQNPEAGLALSGTTLYGTTASGGISGSGTLFKINTDGSGYSLIKAFTNYSDGVYPSTVPVISGATLYGGINYGKVFHINTDGSGYGYFSIDQSGGMPQSVTLEGSTLYGTEMEGGPSYYDGMVYKINTDGSGFTILKVMGGAAGSWPNGPLVLSGKTLYGTAYGRGAYYSGTLFKVNTDGTGFSVLKQFTGGNDGGGPSDGLVLCGDTLYGTTEMGGSSGSGTVFKIRTNGADFVVLKSFNGSDGETPLGNMTLSGTNLYGTTILGGPLGQGVAFRLSVPAVLPVIVANAESQTAELQGSVRFSLRAVGAMPLGYEWYFNGTNLIGWTTNGGLELSDLQFSQSGEYTVVVTNLFGAATSAPALLSIIPRVERRPVPVIGLIGESGSALHLECADRLARPANWLPLDTLSLISTSQFYFDLSAPLPPQRFYRAWQTGTPSVVPSLNLNFVPAITLTGNVGDSLRLDYINAIGPTDAWVTLDTVTLTNTSQLYFDVSSIGQPRRLYRIVPVP